MADLLDGRAAGHKHARTASMSHGHTLYNCEQASVTIICHYIRVAKVHKPICSQHGPITARTEHDTSGM